MSDTVLKVENLHKRYRLGVVNRAAFVDDIRIAWAKLRGKPDPTERYITANELAYKTQDELKREKPKYVWALQDINFEVKRGEVLGIIGKNGAGKSTLLKILSKTTAPTRGQVKVKGRVASLLEVGTGFHPELTGRENIYLNGLILGMKRHEITAKLDEIVDFAGVENYLDTPTKRYSSGMKVRLGFAVAAHLEPDILVVDEVLAVGDAEFQKKAIGKMQEVSQGGGRTVLFVSHNMGSVKALCSRGVLLKEGSVIYEGEANDVVARYISSNSTATRALESDLVNHPNRKKYLPLLTFFKIKPDAKYIYTGSSLNFYISYNFHEVISTPQFCILVYNNDGVLVFSFISDYQRNNIPSKLNGQGEVLCRVDEFNLLPGHYYLTVKLWIPGRQLDEIENLLSFEVHPPDKLENLKKLNYNSSLGVCYFESNWQYHS